MHEGRLILVCGGSRSGKSEFAEKLAASFGESVIYLATSRVWDEEMAQRVEIHRSRRPARWETIEEPLDVDSILRTRGHEGKPILVDCLTLLLTNLFFLEELETATREEKEGYILRKVEDLAKAARQSVAPVVIVTNEIGLGVVPENPLGREFRDLAGKANQLMARYADEVYFTMLGIPVELKALNRLNNRVGTRLGEEEEE